MVPISAVVEVLNEQYAEDMECYPAIVGVEFSWDITTGRIFLNYTEDYFNTYDITVSASYEEVEHNAVGKELAGRLPEEVLAESFMELAIKKLKTDDYTRRYMC